jgi:hypothetical protein
VTFRSRTLPDFWLHYDRLPQDIRRRASKQFAIFAENPRHPSLQLKPVGEFWSVRVTEAYRALAVREENTFTWFWIGTHDEYERMIEG